MRGLSKKKRNRRRSFFAAFLGLLLLSGCASGLQTGQGSHTDESSFKENDTGSSFAEVRDKSYDLPVSQEEKAEAESDCLRIMEMYKALYASADKGSTLNVVLEEQTLLDMQERAGQSGKSIAVNVPYADMENYEGAELFLKNCAKKQEGEWVLYTIHIDGSLGRGKYVFDGQDMYLLAADALWKDSGEPVFSHMSHTRIENWKYTDRGWFGYELCVPEPPQVTEILNGSCLIRVKPYEEKLRKLSRLCVENIGYLQNGLLTTDWDADSMETLDFNSLFGSLYVQKYQERIPYEIYRDGIPAEEFEKVITAYLPIEVDALRQYVSCDGETRRYDYEPQGCFTSTPTFLGTALPEVTAVRENEDGTVTLTVEAVCDMVICSDAALIHELTVKFAEDGSFQYRGNRVIQHLQEK